MQLLNILFCTLMFSGGLPILLPCVSVIFAVTYWAEKWELLKLSRVPSPYHHRHHNHYHQTLHACHVATCKSSIA